MTKMHDGEQAETKIDTKQVSVYLVRTVYDRVVRLWHWFNAACVVILAITGYFIGAPPPSIMGEAGEGYIMGYIRFTHMSVSYLFVVGIFLRVWWAIFANTHARATFYVPVWSRLWCRQFLHQLGWLFFLVRKPYQYVGPDPVSRVLNILLFFIPCIVLIVSGFGMYAEAAGRDSWQYMMFGWLSDFSSNSQDWHTIHRTATWAIVLYAVVHIYMVLHNELVSDTTIISTMISGKRFFRRKVSASSLHREKEENDETAAQL